jgi:hypothetical protein
MHQNEEWEKGKPLRDSKRKKGRRRSGSAAGAELRFGFLGAAV